MRKCTKLFYYCDNLQIMSKTAYPVLSFTLSLPAYFADKGELRVNFLLQFQIIKFQSDDH